MNMTYNPDIFEVVFVPETDSTNQHVRRCTLPEGKDFLVTWTDFQTEGKGQPGNTWESERGQNLTFTLLCHPTYIPVRKQFLLSQIISLSIIDTLSALADGFSIKWPNDIYWQEKKVGGILIEIDLDGSYINTCIIGVGLNINQEAFVSDAPNPISLCQITGETYSREKIMQDILARFDNYYRMLQAGGEDIIRQRYHECLFRRQGYHTFIDCDGKFEARIHHVEDDGRIVLEDKKRMRRCYSFKEVEFFIDFSKPTEE